jgi:acetyltransferase-like isoleucine patch superfamily enzyme
MEPLMNNISPLARLDNSKLCSSSISIEKGASLTNVEIKAKEIIVKSGAILTGCKIFSGGNVVIGKNTTIKEQTIINAFQLVSIGDHVIIDRDVFVGGMQSEKSALQVGNESVILFRSYLNTTRRIILGDNVGIGGYCLIFTHSAWQNVLEGNPYKFADVEIKDNSWLPWNVTVLPGVTIEKDATIGSGSTVTRSIPQSVFAAGIPAKIIRQKNLGQLSLEDRKIILQDILRDFYQYAANFLKLEDLKFSQEGDWTIEYKNTRLIYTLDFKHFGLNDTILSFNIPHWIKKQNMWIELDSKRSNSFDNDLASYFISFVRRYGIKINTEN